MENIDASIIGQKIKSFARNKKKQLNIDMTPMVDLGFLLISFFIFTTTMSTPMTLDLFMTSDKPDPHPPKLIDDLALTMLLEKDNRIFYYHGRFDDASNKNEVFETSYASSEGIGKVIREKQNTLGAGRKGLMLLIKPATNASYKNLIDALDEVMINDVRKYAVLEPDLQENMFLKNKMIRE